MPDNEVPQAHYPFNRAQRRKEGMPELQDPVALDLDNDRGLRHTKITRAVSPFLSRPGRPSSRSGPLE
jgi:hypothetical protein